MKMNRNYLSLLSLALFSLVLFSACEKDDDNQPNEEDGFNIQVVNNATFGKILVNNDNQSIYFFAGDVSGESKCNGGCADRWPAVIGDLYDLQLDSYLDQDDFATITRADGKKQLTYKGWPLYYFSPESDGVLENPGETGGDGLGGLFHIAKPDYTILLGRQPVVAGEDAVTYLVDDRGVSLYLNNGDEENVSNCNGGCAGVWPPFKTVQLVLPSTLNDYDFDSLEREDDLGPQFSFKGSPLYFFSQDEQKRGSVLGQGGGPNQTFFVVEPEVQ
jgi:predicted lipoprotein with Yx(FWY)xxD motif